MIRRYSIRLTAACLLPLAVLGCAETTPLATSLTEAPPTLRALEPQSLAPESLRDGVIEVTVPPGEWRALLTTGLPREHLRVASLPQPGAQPWVGFGSGPREGRVSFLAPPEDEPGVLAADGFFAALATGEDSEQLLLLGSNGAETRFLIGYVEPSRGLSTAEVLLTVINGAPDAEAVVPEQVAALEARPRVSARFESGAGGFAGTVLRIRQPDGRLAHYRAGHLQFEDRSLLTPALGAHLLGHYHSTVEDMALRPGVGSSLALSVLHSGQLAYDVRYTLSPFSRRQIGGGAGVGAAPGGFVLPTSRPEFLLGLAELGIPDLGASNILLHFYWSAVEPGPLGLALDYRFNGRQAEPVSPVRNGAEDMAALQFPDIHWVNFGYAAIDLAALYGWSLLRDTGI